MAEKALTAVYGNGHPPCLTKSRVSYPLNYIPGELSPNCFSAVRKPMVSPRYSMDFFDKKHQVVVSTSQNVIKCPLGNFHSLAGHMQLFQGLQKGRPSGTGFSEIMHTLGLEAVSCMTSKQ